MDSADFVDAGEVRDCPGDPEHAVEPSRAEAHGDGGIGEQLSPPFVRGCRLVEQISIRLCVGPHTVPAISFDLNRTGGGNPRCDMGAAFGRWRQRQVGCADRLHLNM